MAPDVTNSPYPVADSSVGTRDVLQAYTVALERGTAGQGSQLCASFVYFVGNHFEVCVAPTFVTLIVLLLQCSACSAVVRIIFQSVVGGRIPVTLHLSSTSLPWATQLTTAHSLLFLNSTERQPYGSTNDIHILLFPSLRGVLHQSFRKDSVG